MQKTSDTYKTLRTAVGAHYDVRVICNDITYTLADFKSPIKLTRSLFSDEGPQIGQSPSAYVSLAIYASIDNWPRMAAFAIDFRLLSEDEQTASEWITLGSFYTDTRKQSIGGVLSITGYDPMLQFATRWTDKIPEEIMPTSWPITSEDAVNLLHYATEFTLDPRTVLDDTVALVGLDTESTARDVLNTIAAANGGNWCLTPEGKLYLVPIADAISDYSAIAGIAVVGLTVVGQTPDGAAEHLGVMSFDYGEILPEVTGVTLTSFDGTEATATTSSSTSGTTLKADCDFADTAAASLALSKCAGYQYKPFEAETVWLDPAAEIGDFFAYNGSYYRIYESVWSIGTYITVDLSAPVETAVEHEYVVSNETAKTLAKSLSASEAGDAELSEALANAKTELNSSIQQTETRITTQVSENYYTKDSTNTLISGVNSKIEQTATSFEASITKTNKAITDGDNEIKEYVRFENGTVHIGTTEFNQELRAKSNEIGMYVNDVRTTYWSSDEQLTPNKLHIPAGGTLQEGNFLWAPRSSGNLSLMWVGD